MTATTARAGHPATFAPAAILGAIAALAVAVVQGWRIAPAVALLTVCVGVALTYRSLLRWRTLVMALVLVILFVPIKRYHLPATLPFDLEPYRLLVAFIVLGWIASLLVDPRVRLRATFLDGPLLLLLAAVLLSDLVNQGRVGALGAEVIKSLTFLVSFILVYYLVTSVVRKPVDVDFILKVLVVGTSFVALAAIVERQTSFNIFDHLARVIPVLQFEGASSITRGGNFRAIGSAQHPIALSVLFAMVLPLAAYLVKRTGNKWWWLGVVLLGFGTLATGSRTGVIGLVVIVLVALWLRPREVLRLWYFIPPLLIAIHFAMPGALGTIRGSFFPKGGLIADQSGVVPGAVAHSSGRLADLRPSLSEWSDRPLFGQGYATRVTTGPNANARLLDNQWLAALLETGVLGVAAWFWLFVRSVRRLGRLAKSRLDSDGWLAATLAASLAVYGATMITYDSFGFVQVTFAFFILAALSARVVDLLDRPQAAES